MLDPRRLLTFREVARTGSFSRAAEALALSQPAVSHQVAALERELGTALLVRGRAGTVPTPAGELLLVHAEALAARLALADDPDGALAAAERRTLRIGAFPSALATIVPAAIARRARGSRRWRSAIEEGRARRSRPRSRQGGSTPRSPSRTPPRRRASTTGCAAPSSARSRCSRSCPPGTGSRAASRIALRALAARRLDGAARRRDAGRRVPRRRLRAADRRAHARPARGGGLAAAGLAVSLTPRLAARLPLPGVVTPALRGGGPRRALYALAPRRGRAPARRRAGRRRSLGALAA